MYVGTIRNEGLILKIPKIIVGGVIRQQPTILKEYLTSLAGLEREKMEVSFSFIDDNSDPEASRLLNEFVVPCHRTRVRRVNPEGEYHCTEKTHLWTAAAISRVGRLKDQLLEEAVQEGCHLFLVDSDLMLHPWTLQQLYYSGREIVSEIFWTQWQPDKPFLPQVWVKGHYTLFHQKPDERLTPEETVFRIHNFLNMLRQPGLYEVGGLGACTLIRIAALEKGVRFAELPNLEMFGEDRHFCIRAAALGFSLYVDTQLPAYHIYRSRDLEGIPVYRENCNRSVRDSLALGRTPQALGPQKTLNEKRRIRTGKNHLTLVMLVRNEANRYLATMLEQSLQFIDAAVIVDDASTDGTPEICRRLCATAGLPLLFHQNPEPGFHNEVELRKQAWELALGADPEWLLFLDADEIFENRATNDLRPLLADPRWDFYSFRLYDFWDQEHFREDRYWQAHFHYRPFLLRYQPEYEYEWADQPLHCGRLPKNAANFPGTASSLRLKHYGWSDPERRLQKYHFYLAKDPEAQWGVAEQYRSILDPDPHLVEWKE
jgi:hypothetical protein